MAQQGRRPGKGSGRGQGKGKGGSHGRGRGSAARPGSGTPPRTTPAARTKVVYDAPATVPEEPRTFRLGAVPSIADTQVSGSFRLDDVQIRKTLQ